MNKAIIITGVVLLLSLLIVYDHRVLAAASAGRMGGTSFRSSRSSRSRSTSTSTSAYPKGYSILRSSYYSRRYNTRTGCSPVAPARQVLAFEFGLLEFCVIVGTTFAIYLLFRRYADEDRHKTSVLKLQVALSGTARSLQKDLNQIAETADTSSPKGFRYILQETILSMLQHPDYCNSGYSLAEVKRGVDECEKRFNEISIEERGKFDEETLVNFNNIRKQSATSHEDVSDAVCNRFIVVTIIVAAHGARELPPVKSSEQLKLALEKLISIPSNNIMAAEVLWTPQKADDSLTEQEMLEDYPLLHRL